MIQNEILIKFNTLNKNGRIYTSEEFTKSREDVSADGNIIKYTLLEKINKFGLRGQIGHSDSAETKNPTHTTKNFRIENDCLIGDVEPIGHNISIINTLLENKKFVVRPRSIGTINEDLTVSLEDIVAFDIVDVKEDSFN